MTAQFIDAHPQLVSNVMMTVGSLVALRGAIAAIRFVDLLGKGGALSMMAMGMSTLGRAGYAVFDAVNSAIALRRAIETLHARKAADVFGEIAVGLQQVSSPVRLTAMQRLRAILSGLAGVTGLTAVSQGIAAVGAVLAGISAPVWLGIAVAVAAAGAAWKYWDRITAIVGGVADAIGTVLQPVIESIKVWLEPVQPILNRVGAAFGFLGGKVGNLVGIVRSLGGSLFSREILTNTEQAELRGRAAQITTDLIAYFAALSGKLLTIGGEMIQKLWDGMKAKWTEFQGWLSEIPGKISGAFNV